MDIQRNKKCVYKLEYHIVLVTKYRNNVINQDIHQFIYSCFLTSSDIFNVDLIEFNSDLNHVHILVSATPQLCIYKYIQHLKGYSAYLLLKNDFVKQFYWGKHFWNPSYFIATISDNTEQKIKEYIKIKGGDIMAINKKQQKEEDFHFSTVHGYINQNRMTKDEISKLQQQLTHAQIAYKLFWNLGMKEYEKQNLWDNKRSFDVIKPSNQWATKTIKDNFHILGKKMIGRKHLDFLRDMQYVAMQTYAEKQYKYQNDNFIKPNEFKDCKFVMLEEISKSIDITADFINDYNKFFKDYKSLKEKSCQKDMNIYDFIDATLYCHSRTYKFIKDEKLKHKKEAKLRNHKGSVKTFGKPRYKRTIDDVNTISWYQNFATSGGKRNYSNAFCEGGFLKLAFFGKLPIKNKKHYIAPEKIVAIHLSQECGKIKYTIVYHKQKKVKKTKQNKSLSIDLNSANDELFATLDTNDIYKVFNFRHLSEELDELETYRRMLDTRISNCRKNGIPYNGLLVKRQKAIKRSRNLLVNWILHVASKLSQENDVIYMEDLKDMRQLGNTKGWNRRLSVLSLGKIKEYFIWACNKNNTQIVFVNPYVTSKTCNDCGYVFHKLKVGMKQWTCSKCGTDHDRDYNACKNIMRLGISMAS